VKAKALRRKVKSKSEGTKSDRRKVKSESWEMRGGGRRQEVRGETGGQAEK
jgi:hypothetical protein